MKIDVMKCAAFCNTLLHVFILAGGPKKESAEDDDMQEPEAPEPFEWPDDL